ncbi:hypothetical protein [uncultured Polaribacter sp.]|uniref:hypothetical protein n=1 Tax=uncultured Polaribacter sp. TaxID=174711 RepID=UPI0026174C13|nr:hypothetical protein [uncultured Polaribacter sp.]
MIRKIISSISILIFVFYWMTTLIFVSPKNYLNINLLEYSDLFNSFFYQKWGFFAPPPKTNERLYYTFENKFNSKDIQIFEVIEPITKAKSENNPFNTEEDLLDYVLSNSINNIRETVINTSEFIKYQEKKLNKKFTELEKEKIYDSEIDNSSRFKTLKNYSKNVAIKNNININNYNIKLTISLIEIVPFSERNNIIYICKTEDMYISKSFNLNNDEKIIK